MNYPETEIEQHLIKKESKKFIAWGAVALVAVLVFGYIQLSWFGGVVKSDTNWLVVLHAGKAEISTIEGETFLTIRSVSRDTVFFSDRPERKYQSINTYEFIEQWDTLFSDSPPNAAMVHGEVGVDNEVVIVELFKPTIRLGRIYFPIEIIGGEYTEDTTYEDVNLFIDSFWDDVLVAVAGTGPTGASPPKKGDPTPTQQLKTFGKTIGKTFDLTENLKILAKAVDVGGWEGSLQKSLVSAVTVAADIGGDAGAAKGGEKGRQIGSRVGAQLGITAVQTSMKAILRSDIDGTSSLDLEALTDEIKKAVEASADDFSIAYGITDIIFNEEGENIKAIFVTSLKGLAAEYNQSTLCGAAIDKDNVLFDAFMYSLRITLEGRIYYDLEAGMSVEEIKADVVDNLESDIRLAILYSIWELQDYCTYDIDDLYTQLFYELYVFQFTARSGGEFPELGGVVVDGVAIPVEGVSGTYQRVPTQGPSGVEYYTSDIEFDARVESLMREAERRYEVETGISPSEAQLSLGEIYSAELQEIVNSVRDGADPLTAQELQIGQQFNEILNLFKDDAAVETELLEPIDVTITEYNPLLNYKTDPDNAPFSYEMTNADLNVISSAQDSFSGTESGVGNISSRIKARFTRVTTNVDNIIEGKFTKEVSDWNPINMKSYRDIEDLTFITNDMLTDIAENSIKEVVEDEVISGAATGQ